MTKPKKGKGNPLGNPGSRTPVVCYGVTDIEITGNGFKVTCKRIETAPTNVTAKADEPPTSTNP